MANNQNELIEFLSLGVKEYCKKYQFQCCHLCNNIQCCDNDNPLVLKLNKIKSEFQKIKSPSDFTEKVLKELNEIIN